MNQNPHNRRSDGAYYPESPVIGRFVSPWDTSGWYSVFAGFDVGAKLHSNEEVTADYILTVLAVTKPAQTTFTLTFNSDTTARSGALSLCILKLEPGNSQ